ncbi:MAG: class IV adenylate cyclase [Desulfuromonas sp.]|nr:class IV adenylate cyclase [Desulfuromonas sp.]
MYEVELKATVTDVNNLLCKLNEFSATAEIKTYEDTYFNNEQNLLAQDKELRLRLIEHRGAKTVLLTYKDPPFDALSRSKPEIELELSSHQQAVNLLEKLGFTIDISFKKNCTIYSFHWLDLAVELTIAQIPELAATFVEIETLVADKNETTAAFEKLYALVQHLKIPQVDITSEYYTDAVRAARTLSR